MTTPIQTMYDFLEESDMFGEWLDHNGDTQEALVVQMRTLEETEAGDAERILLIKTISAGGGTRFVSEPVFVFAVLGKVGESEIYAEDYAELLYAELLNFEHDDCIISIDPMGRINGPYKMESGRSAYDMEFTVKVDSGHIS